MTTTSTFADTRSLRPLADRYRAVRDLTERLAEPLSAEDQTVQSMPDVSPTKWHRAHTTWFFETFVLGEHVPGYEPFDPDYGFLFNSYYEAVGPRHSRVERGLLTRPGVAEVADYRRHVDAAMGRLLAGGRRLPAAVATLVELGLHHEQQHQELLLMDIKHVLSLNPLRPAYVGCSGLSDSTCLMSISSSSWCCCSWWKPSSMVGASLAKVPSSTRSSRSRTRSSTLRR